MINKKCTKCGIEKGINEFYKRNLKENKIGLQSLCKMCKNNNSKQYRVLHKLETKEYNEKYYLKNKDKIREKKREYSSIYAAEHRRQKSRYDKKYRIRNKDKIREKRRISDREKRRNNVEFKLRDRISTAIRQVLKSVGSKKKRSLLNFLPYTMEQLKQHLESQFEFWMSWNNHGIYTPGGERKWHIDHITPQSALLYDSMEHPNFQKCWALSNLRPLEAKENIKKGNKIIGE